MRTLSSPSPTLPGKTKLLYYFVYMYYVQAGVDLGCLVGGGRKRSSYKLEKDSRSNTGVLYILSIIKSIFVSNILKESMGLPKSAHDIH